MKDLESEVSYLKGTSDTWVKTTKLFSLGFTNLDPGEEKKKKPHTALIPAAAAFKAGFVLLTISQTNTLFSRNLLT